MSELQPAATYLGSQCCGKWGQIASPRVWLYRAVCVFWDARLPWQQTGGVIWRSRPFYSGCLNSRLKLLVGREQGQTNSRMICCQFLTAQHRAARRACNSYPSHQQGMFEHRGSGLSTRHRFKLLRLKHNNRKSKNHQTISALQHSGHVPSSIGSVDHP